MRVTTKGQVTIPKDIRDRLGIGPGSEVDFVPTEDGARLVPVNQTNPRMKCLEDSAQHWIGWRERWISEA